jgi:hypothetical protein
MKGVKKAALALFAAAVIIAGIYLASGYILKTGTDGPGTADRVRLDAEKELSVLQYRLVQQQRTTDSLQAVHNELKDAYEDGKRQLDGIKARYNHLRLSLAAMDEVSKFDYFRSWLSEADALGQRHGGSDYRAANGVYQPDQDRARRVAGD